MEASNWIGLVGVVITAVATAFAIRSELHARRSARDASDAESRATEAAERAAAAEDRAADAAERAAAALEKQADRFEPRWRFRRTNTNLIHLINDTGDDAHDVEVALDDPWHFAEGEDWMAGRTPANASKRYPRIAASSSVAFFVTNDGDPADAYLVVTWERVPAGPRFTWRVPALLLVTD
jgi:hypothetical protein